MSNPNEFNVYTTRNKEFNLVNPAWIAPKDIGFTDDESAAWKYDNKQTLLATGVVLYYNENKAFDFTVQVFDDLGVLIPGTSSMVPNGPMCKALYTFDNPVTPDTKLHYKVTSGTIPLRLLKFLINVTVVIQPQQ
jgi:hypothetical protein